MKTYTESLGLLRSMTKIGTTDTTNDALLMQFYDDSVRTILNIRGGKWWFLEGFEAVATQANVAGYVIPNNLRKITTLTVTVGTTIYSPTPVFNSQDWQLIKSSNMGSDDATLYYYPTNGNVELYPAPASNSNTIIIYGRKTYRGINIADYTTGTITTVAAAGTTVTGNGTSWNASMIGKWIKIANTGSVNGGDGMWYKITAVASATSLTILQPYQGTAISAGSAAYIIGDMTIIPEAYDMAPIYRTLALWNQINNPTDLRISTSYWKLYDGGQEIGMSNEVNGILGQMLENEGASMEASYISPMPYQNLDPNNPPRDITGLS